MTLYELPQKIFAVMVFVGIICPQTSQADFVNGDFETGDMTGWTITPGTNARYEFDDVIMFDIDGVGPNPISNVLSLSVGQMTYEASVYRHVDITQDLSLELGKKYEFSFDWAVHNFFIFDNFDGGIFELIVDDQVLATHDTGGIFFMSTERGALDAEFIPTQSGDYTVGARISRRFPIPFPDDLQPTLLQYLDNFSMTSSAVPEPTSTSMMFLVGIVGLALRRRKRAANKRQQSI